MMEIQIKQVNVTQIEAESALDLLLFVETTLEESIERLVSNTNRESDRKLLSLYQKHLALTVDFKSMLMKTASYLHDRVERATRKEMDEFLEIESAAKQHACKLIRWMDDDC